MSSDAEVASVELTPAAQSEHLASRLRPDRFGFWPRLTIVMALLAIGYGAQFADAVSDAFSGSRSALLAVAPLLIVLAAHGYRSPPRGVVDHEADWIFTVLAGLIGYGIVAFLYHRYPTLSGLWRLDLIGAVIWAVCAAIVVFGIRYAIRGWGVWLFAILCVSPWPFLLMTAALGGSHRAAAVTAAIFGTVGACLASADTPPRKRYPVVALFGLGNMAIAAIMVGQTTLVVTVCVVAAGLPTVFTVALRAFTANSDANRAPLHQGQFPKPSRRSLVALTMIAGLLLVLHPFRTNLHTPPAALPDWTERAGLSPQTELAFIRQYLGPQASFVRYDTPRRPGLPAARVDVLTTPKLAPLLDYANVVWYPTRRPVNYQPADPEVAPARLNARVALTDAYQATSNASMDWYAVTWVWRTASAYQQVFIVVDQTDGTNAPPIPQAPSAANTGLLPALWIARTQPEGRGNPERPVLNRATALVRAVTKAGLINAG